MILFELKADARGLDELPSTGPYATYVAGHPDGRITRRSSFNFGAYQSGIAGFGRVRVFGDEIFTPSAGYNMHPHHNFIIMAFVLKGALTHINTLAKVDELKPGDYYAFSAGSGGKHCELNVEHEDLNVLYLWMLPDRLHAPPSYARGRFDFAADKNRIVPLAGFGGGLELRQDLKVSRLFSDAGRAYPYPTRSRAHGSYVFVIEGEATVDGHTLGRRDSIALAEADSFEIAAARNGTDILIVETIQP